MVNTHQTEKGIKDLLIGSKIVDIDFGSLCGARYIQKITVEKLEDPKDIWSSGKYYDLTVATSAFEAWIEVRDPEKEKRLF
jgi:hypothetical protein